MGSLCCCFRAPPELDEESGDSDVDEENAESSATTNRSAPTHLTSFMQNLTNRCEAVFRGGSQPVPSSDEGPSTSRATIAQSSSSGSSSSISSGNGTSLMSHAKGLNSSRVEPEPLYESNVQLTASGGGSVKSNSAVPTKVVVDKARHQVCILSEDDEDVCPICLEEYTTENPRIVTECLHHYHLGCIYDWKERSETCPVCSKLMVFEEMT